MTEHEGLPLVPPAALPVDGLSLLRCAIVAEERGAFAEFHRAAFRATWGEGKPTSERAFAASLLAEAIGVAQAEAETAMADASVKSKLRENTERAAARGVFGVPTFFVGDEMFWGHDRMDYVLREASR